MAQKIPESTVTEVESLLIRRAAEYGWTCVRTEVQDESEFLLVQVEVGSDSVVERMNGRIYAYDVLDARVPPKGDGTYSWMVVFLSGGEVLDSVMHEVV
jgi:hypothetical protein